VTDLHTALTAALHDRYAAALCVSDLGMHGWAECDAKAMWTGDAADIFATLPRHPLSEYPCADPECCEPPTPQVVALPEPSVPTAYCQVCYEPEGNPRCAECALVPE
jgi:hypothetical protein